ncbi:MAG: aspartic peptidase domain-containing protein [Monoraphidium minutum]|nr:MAG: aspartic peptidase domain-containing protein [Monoraphidium minutum]
MRRAARLFAALALLAVPLAAAAGGGAVVRLQRHAGRSPERARHGRHLLLRSERADIKGSVHDGYFTAPLMIGTPPQSFDLIVDTGSTMTYVPCGGCERCGAHTSPPYAPDASSTSTRIACGDASCAALGGSRCVGANQCYYSLSYAEASSSEGYLIRDVVNLPGADGAPLQAVVGCVNYETGMIYSQKADGLIGLGNAPRAFPQQIAASGQLSNVFGLCFGFPSGGALLLGDAPLPAGVAAPAWAPLLKAPNQYYTVFLEAIDIADGEAAAAAADGDGMAAAPGFTALPIEAATYAQGYGAVLDSGTTFNYLPSAAFRALSSRLQARLLEGGHDYTVLNPGTDLEDICWDLPTEGSAPSDAWASAAAAFPRLRLRFGGGAALLLPPQRYVFAVDGDRGGKWRFCLGFFDNGNDGTLIGGIAVRDVLVVYDLENNRVGFSEADCDVLAPPPALDDPPTIGGHGGEAAAAGDAGARGAPGAGDAAAGAAARGKEGELVASERPQAPVTAAMRPRGAGNATEANVAPAASAAAAAAALPLPVAAPDASAPEAAAAAPEVASKEGAEGEEAAEGASKEPAAASEEGGDYMDTPFGPRLATDEEKASGAASDAPKAPAGDTPSWADDGYDGSDEYWDEEYEDDYHSHAGMGADKEGVAAEDAAAPSPAPGGVPEEAEEEAGGSAAAAAAAAPASEEGGEDEDEDDLPDAVRDEEEAEAEDAEEDEEEEEGGEDYVGERAAAAAAQVAPAAAVASERVGQPTPEMIQGGGAPSGDSGGGDGAAVGSHGGVLTTAGLAVAGAAAAALLVSGVALLRSRARRRASAARGSGWPAGGGVDSRVDFRGRGRHGFAPLGAAGEERDPAAMDCELAALAVSISMEAEDARLLGPGGGGPDQARRQGGGAGAR